MKCWRASYNWKKLETMGCNCSSSGIICMYNCWRNFTVHVRESLQKTTSVTSFPSISSAAPAYSGAAYLKGRKSPLEKLERKLKGGDESTQTWIEAEDWSLAGEQRSSFWKTLLFAKAPNLSTATGHKHFPRTINSVISSRENMKFSSSLRGSPTSSLEITIFSSNLHWSQIKHENTVFFQSVKRNWGTISLKVYGFHCRDINMKLITCIKVYDCVTSFEYSKLSNIKVMIPECIFSVQSNNPLKTVFVFIAKALQRTGVLLGRLKIVDQCKKLGSRVHFWYSETFNKKILTCITYSRLDIFKSAV